jgi:type II secretory pathway pseudopilin PulG
MHAAMSGRTSVRLERARTGFTLVELIVSFSALLIVLLGFSRMMLSSRMASSTAHEATLAKEAARGMIEILKAHRLPDTYATYNADTTDGGSAPVAGFVAGDGFPVRGLEAHEGLAEPGQIIFPEQGGELSELVNLPQMGWTNLDLNGDGDHDDVNVSDEYKFLPVAVRVSWRGAGGPGSVEFRTLIANF